MSKKNDNYVTTKGGLKVNKYIYVAIIAVLVIGFLALKISGVLPQQADNASGTESTVNTVSVQTQSQADSLQDNRYSFRTDTYAKQHFEKHGSEFDYATLEEYVKGANRVIASKDALTKTEKEDGDYVYDIEDTNEFVILSKDGYIRTYFKPSGGKAYFDRQ